MAVMAVKIENEASLLMNEFFDYNGSCYSISRSRFERSSECAALEDFYECTVRTEWIDDIPVVFVFDGMIIGWYKKARISRNLQVVSPFLEGNIQAKTLDAVLLSKADRRKNIRFDFKEKMYEVIEEDDERYEYLMAMTQNNARVCVDVRYGLVESFYSADKLRLVAAGYGKDQRKARKAMRDYCVEKCMEIAQRIMSDSCKDIRELKTMLQYAKQAIVYDRKCTDAWYYRAMASEQLGFIKDGLKSIEKAIALEPDADDLLTEKGHLLFAMKNYEAAIENYEEAYSISPDDGYLMHIGLTWFVMGNVDVAYKTYKRVTDKQILEEWGINLKDMEKKWPFVSVRGFSFKDLFNKNN